MIATSQVQVTFSNRKIRGCYRKAQEAQEAIDQGFARLTRGGVCVYVIFPLMNAEGQVLRKTDWREGSRLVKEGFARIVKTKRGPALAIGQVEPNKRTAVSREHIFHETRNNPPRVYAHKWKPGLDMGVCG